MATSTSVTPLSNHRKTLSVSDYHRDILNSTFSSDHVQNEKLKITFEKQQIESQMQIITNRISKILANKKKTIEKKRNESKISESAKEKQERNQKKKEFMEKIRNQRMQQTAEFKEIVKKDRIQRMSKIKELEKEIVTGNKDVVKKIKLNEKGWEEQVKIQKTAMLEENAKKVMSMKMILKEQAQQRCLSQRMDREKTRMDYEVRVNKLKNEKLMALNNLKALESQFLSVLKTVEESEL